MFYNGHIYGVVKQKLLHDFNDIHIRVNHTFQFNCAIHMCGISNFQMYIRQVYYLQLLNKVKSTEHSEMAHIWTKTHKTGLFTFYQIVSKKYKCLSKKCAYHQATQ